MFVYKVKHIPSGLYWKGGGVPTHKTYDLKKADPKNIESKVLKMKFSKNGKVWGQANHVSTALLFAKSDKYMKDILDQCETSKFELVLVPEKAK